MNLLDTQSQQTRHGVGEGRAILRLHYPTVRPDRQQRIVLLFSHHIKRRSVEDLEDLRRPRHP